MEGVSLLFNILDAALQRPKRRRPSVSLTGPTLIYHPLKVSFFLLSVIHQLNVWISFDRLSPSELLLQIGVFDRLSRLQIYRYHLRSLVNDLLHNSLLSGDLRLLLQRFILQQHWPLAILTVLDIGRE